MSSERTGGPAGHLLCEHRWVPRTPERDEQHCLSCGLGYAEYVHGTVRAALTRMGAWD